MITEPLYRKIGEELLGKINAGDFAPNSRLPAIRTLATELGVNNTTIVSAYKYLEQKRAVYSVRGSGVYVANQNEKPAPVFFSAHGDCINFAATGSDTSFFPKEDFRRAFDAVLLRDGASVFSSAGGRGYMPLRETISALLAINSVQTTPENIQITTDIRSGLALVLQKLIGPGDAVVLESPCAPWAAAAFAFCGAKILEMPLNSNGPDLDRLIFLAKKHKPKIFFFMPNYQQPTGLCYTNDVKEKLLVIAQNTNAHIIEADDCGDFFYDEKPKPLRAANERVIYLKSFERVLSPGLAGYIVYPKDATPHETEGVSGYIQRGLDYYLRNNDYDAFCAKIRGVFAKRYRRAIAAAETFLAPYADFIIPGGGLGLWVSPKNSGKTAAYIDEFLIHKVLVSPGRFFAPSVIKPAAERHFRISFANTNEDDISKGIGIIASVLAH